MGHWLKKVRLVVKIVAAFVSLCFALNGANGIVNAIQLADGNITTEEVNPGDFEINFNNLSVNVGVKIKNPGVYDIEGVIIGIIFEVQLVGNDTWFTILNNDTVKMGQAPAGGATIKPGELVIIGINATMADFLYQPAMIGIILGLPPNWDLQTLITAGLEARLLLNFAIIYAYGQFDLDINLSLNTAAIAQGFA
jgi:hypothetical protein